MNNYSLAELVIVACAESWRGTGEVMAFGAGPLPRLGANLAKMTFNPELMTTDGECFYTSEPIGPGCRSAPDNVEGWSPYNRTFDTLWGGKRVSMVAPVQIDRFGQTNISKIGDHNRPKVALVGVRGFPGNSVHHRNNFFFATHDKRTFVGGEVDYVCMAGYNPPRWINGRQPIGLDLGIIVTNLCVMDFGGPDHQIRVISLHPGVELGTVEENTGFPLARISENIPPTPVPTIEQLDIIDALDPHKVRDTVFKKAAKN